MSLLDFISSLSLRSDRSCASGEDDYLEFSNIAKKLAIFASSPLTETPLVIGIYGRWGTGKSSLLNLIKYELDEQRRSDDGEKITTFSFHFNPWKYQSETSVLPYLIKNLQRDAYSKLKEIEMLYKIIDATHQRIIDQVKIVTKNIFKAAFTGVTQLVGKTINSISGLPLTRTIEGGFNLTQNALSNLFESLEGEEDEDIKKLHDLIKEVAPDDILSLIDLDIILRTTIEAYLIISNIHAQVERLNDKSSYNLTEKLNEIFNHLKFNFLSAFRISINDENIDKDFFKDLRLVLLIDDLDRCTPKVGFTLLESIKVHLDAPNLIYFLALDHELAKIAVKTQLDYLKSEKNEKPKKQKPYYEIYLDKIIQLSYFLPRPSEKNVEDFLTHNLSEILELPSMKITLDEKTNLLSDFVTMSITGLNSNPRKIKRIINSLVLYLAFEDDTFLAFDKEDLLIRFRIAWKLLILQLEWSTIFNELEQVVRFVENPVLQKKITSEIIEEILREDPGLGETADMDLERWIPAYFALRRQVHDFIYSDPQIDYFISNYEVEFKEILEKLTEISSIEKSEVEEETILDITELTPSLMNFQDFHMTSNWFKNKGILATTEFVTWINQYSSGEEEQYLDFELCYKDIKQNWNIPLLKSSIIEIPTKIFYEMQKDLILRTLNENEINIESKNALNSILKIEQTDNLELTHREYAKLYTIFSEEKILSMYKIRIENRNIDEPKPSFEIKFITSKTKQKVQSKLKSIWKLPGTRQDYVNFITKFVDFIEEEGSPSEIVVEWINKQKDPERAKQELSPEERIGEGSVIGGYLRMMEVLGIVKSRKSRIIRLDILGQEFKENQNQKILLNGLVNRFLYIVEILDILEQSESPLSMDDIWKKLEDKVSHGWKTTHQVRFRLYWLLSFGCIEQRNSDYGITNYGSEFLNERSNTPTLN